AIRNLLAVQLIWGSAPYLTTELGEIAFSFNGPVLNGVSVRRPADERALYLVEDLFPDALGKAYVDLSFSPEAKAQIEQLVANIIVAFKQRILNSAWMSDTTKQKAIEKLDLLAVKVGYPDTWKSYDEVSIGDSLYSSLVSVDTWAKEQDLAKIGKPVDRSEWSMAPFIVNAYYNPTANEIVFPAAILQAPFFDPEADAASNYGSIGWVIGHEITHGFDQSGSQFDGYGNISPWWTDEDRAAFDKLNAQVADQYSAIEVLPGLHVNGELTVTENVADLGGLQTAYDAMLVEIGQAGQENQPWFLTQQQRFFIAAASTWREKATEQYTRYLVSSDSHAPSTVRSVQPARNMTQFYEAFDITEGEPMYLPPDERITVW
ncbi:MAG TPA: M13 family metallopeptidase, partial [Thermomicrobiales bacterium]|nr:M13 family metallopeptidase [Thermomicrobiales bacterium]